MTLEDVQNKRKRLIFRSWHRGMKEMDLIMGTFADENVAAFSEEQLVQYEELLQQNDPDLYSWVSRKEEPPANVKSDVFEKLMKHKFA